MKKHILFLMLCAINTGFQAQTNTFPASGNVGIGTTAPSGKLHVSSGTEGDAVFKLEADTNNDNELNNPILKFRQDGGIVGANVGFSENFGENLFGIGIVNPNLSGGLRWNAVVINTVDGNVGIGTNTVSAFKLSVNGKIRAKEIKVEANWADYVFEDGYHLPSLQQVKQHIQEKGHLINIPSAKEVEENGIALGEMNKRLLEKIEELTLYTLQQEEKLQVQKEANKKLEKRLSLLETQLQKLINTKTHIN
ncbi:hypothetical protein [Ascidiimonas aurantiaca]|uniref:hypothetical protein n=1 Tax=Ascidiimonas aurantiaca TaxID=1685432 RepID=UPI0030EB22A5